MDGYTQLLDRERTSLKSLVSDMATQKEELDKPMQLKLEADKLDLEKLKAELRKEKDDLNEEKEILAKEKLELELMRCDIQKQSDLLEEEKYKIKQERDTLEMTKAEIQLEKEDANKLSEEINAQKTKMKEMTLQLDTERDQLDNSMNKISLKQQEQELKEAELQVLQEKMESTQRSVLSARQELEDLKNNLNKQKDEVEAGMTIIREERQQLNQIKMDLERGREMLITEKQKIRSEEEDLVNKMKPMELLKVKLQQLNEKMSLDLKHKMDSLQQKNEDLQKLYSGLEQGLVLLNSKKEHMDGYTQLLDRERTSLKSLVSDMATQKEELDKPMQLKLEADKLDLEKLKAELRKEKDDLNEEKEILVKEKLELELEKDQMKKHWIKDIFDKAVQTECFSKICAQDYDATQHDLYFHTTMSECEDDFRQSCDMLETEPFEHQCDDKEDQDLSSNRDNKNFKKHQDLSPMLQVNDEAEKHQKLKPTALLNVAEEHERLLEEKSLHWDSLQNIWRENQSEQKEINQMTSRSDELRNNLARRVQVINQIVRGTGLQKAFDKKKLKQKTLDRELQYYQEKDHKTLTEKYTVLQQLKAQMLSEIERLNFNKKVCRTLITSNNQTSDEIATAGKATNQASTQTNAEKTMVKMTEAATGTNSRRLCQLWHCCSGYCCACCKTVHQK
ncbi:titin homolog [Notolabrus celidotus]|uniref:titin homolog n=1 Tax=Notolabrus celidotus TaxID=1203425 RepID=UPI0014901AC6|nr:titin homolog [Notolabrus celidotus]